MKALALIALLTPAITHAAIVQDAEDAWRATATAEGGALYLDIDPAGEADWVCPVDRLHVIADGKIATAIVEDCDWVSAPVRFPVTGNFNPDTASVVIWNGTRIRVLQPPAAVR